MIQHVGTYARPTGTEAELLLDLRRTVESRGDTVVATYVDDGRMTGRGRNFGWRKLVGALDQADLIVLSTVGDLPGKTVADLLKILSLLRDHNVGLYLHNECIDTASATFPLLDIIDAFRRAKLSQAICRGQAKAVAAGKRIGRPTVPYRIQSRIREALAQGGGIRPTARRFNVSPASVINIRRAMTVVACIS
jgi:DNA invertase Pin-like site-specific DNA recombinase